MSIEGLLDLLHPHAYFYQFGNIRIASKTSDKFYRLDAAALVLLSQIIYWTPKARKNGYWIYKTQAEFSEETALSCKQIARARTDLEALRLIWYKYEGYPVKAYYKLNTDMLMQYAASLAEKEEDEDPTVYITQEELDKLELITNEESPSKLKIATSASEIPDEWLSIFEQVRSCGFYADKSDKDKNGEFYVYNQKLYAYITEILDGTFYEKSGKNITNRKDLTGLTREKILEWITAENRLPAGKVDYAHKAIVYLTSKTTYSPMLNALCGGSKPTSTKPLTAKIKPSSRKEIETFYRGKVRVVDDAHLDFIWNNSSNPSFLYPELEEDSPIYWGVYFEVAEIHLNNYREGKEGTDVGIWRRNNNNVEVSVQTIVQSVFESAKATGFTLEEILYYLKIGDDRNYLWALTVQWVFTRKSSRKIWSNMTEKSIEYVCSGGRLDPNRYTGVPERLKGEKK